jgi:hypothetical protein
MPVQLLSVGYPYTLQTNVVYAAPINKTTIFCGDSSPALEQSNIADFSVKSPITLTGGLGTVAGAFIRATTGTPLVVFSRD